MTYIEDIKVLRISFTEINLRFSFKSGPKNTIRFNSFQFIITLLPINEVASDNSNVMRESI